MSRHCVLKVTYIFVYIKSISYDNLLQVIALDSDAAENGTVRYSSRARGAARGLLRVHARSGRLYAAPRLSLAPHLSYDLTVSCCRYSLLYA